MGSGCIEYKSAGRVGRDGLALRERLAAPVRRFSRPADERYLSLSELHAAMRGPAERSRTRTAETAAIRVEANRDDAEGLTVDPWQTSAEPIWHSSALLVASR